ncbi:MAG: hypothetical protein HKN85_07545 [Gammaproteobacteria bacterium]|nr:hypothetical protein [Gammaproteobacteria bacterium]
MKKAHRTAHRWIWLLLLPALLGFIFTAERAAPGKAPVVETTPYPSEAGELP